MHDRLYPVKTTVEVPIESDSKRMDELRAAVSDRDAGTLTLSALQNAVLHGLVLGEPADLLELASQLGPSDYSRLRSNLVRLPCTSCQSGHETCGGCDGTGLLEDGAVCRPCAGFGRVRCDFCGGTGLAPYEVFPHGLCPEVARGRVALAISRSAHLHSVMQGEESTRLYGESKWVQRILNFNMLVGVLENARSEMLRLAEHPGFRAVARPIRSAAESGAQLTFDRLLNSIAGLVTSLNPQRESASTAQPSSALAKFEFYDALLGTRNFKGTPLEHAFLGDLLAQKI